MDYVDYVLNYLDCLGDDYVVDYVSYVLDYMDNVVDCIDCVVDYIDYVVDYNDCVGLRRQCRTTTKHYEYRWMV